MGLVSWTNGQKVYAADLNANFTFNENIKKMMFGNGADGTYTLDGSQAAVSGLFSKSGSTYTLLRDAYFDTLTINSGVILESANFRIFAKTLLTVNGTIRCNGGNASGQTAGAIVPTGFFATVVAGSNGGGSGAAASNATASNPAAIGSTGAKGGAQGTLSTGTGSATPGAVTLTTKSPISNYWNLMTLWETTPGASPVRMTTGGASTGGDGAGSSSGPFTCGVGGGAGAIGGTIGIFAKTLAGNGTIEAKGGNGGNGAGGGTYACNGAGGGGGGNGGFIFIFTSTNSFTGTISVAGGTGGTGGTKEANGVQNGGPGANGTTGDTVTIIV